MIENSDLQLIGRVHKIFGVNGTFDVSLLEGASAIDFDKIEYLFISINKLYVPFYLQACSLINNNIRVTLEDISSTSEVKEFLGNEVAILRKNISYTSQDYSFFSLIGCVVYDKGKKVGVVTQVFDENTNLLIEIDHTYLAPLHENLVEAYIPEQKKLLLDLPEGIFSI